MCTRVVTVLPPRHLKVETCITPTAAVRALRELAQEAGWRCRRIQGTRLVDRWAIIMPIAQGSRTIGLEIESGPLTEVAMEAYSHVRGSAGALTVVEWLIPNELEDEWRQLFAEWTARLPRCPWKWTFGERSTLGYFLPVFSRSRRLFRRQGVNVSKKAWPEQDLPVWPPDEWLVASEEE
jgi:hypothetical protein